MSSSRAKGLNNLIRAIIVKEDFTGDARSEYEAMLNYTTQSVSGQLFVCYLTRGTVWKTIPTLLLVSKIFI